MREKLISITLLFVIALSIFNISSAEEMLDINAKSAILIDYHTGEVIYEKNSDEKLPPASLSKIMTLLLSMESLDDEKINLSDEVRISSYASGMGGSQLWLEEGEIQTVENLLKAICLRSANDASVAMAEHISGSEKTFVELMNKRSKELGMLNTNFTNSTGLPNDNHYTSAHDIGLMSTELLKHKKIHDWLTTYMDELIVGKRKDKVQSLVNTNRLVKDYPGTIGIKTGSTKEAGFCISASAKKDNLQLISVIMGSETSKIRFEESIKLLEYGFANYDSIIIGKKGDVLAQIPIHKGISENVELVLEKDSYILRSKGDNENIEKRILLPDFIESPVEEGQEIGCLILEVNGEKSDEIKLVSRFKIEKASFPKMFEKTIKNFLINK